MTLLEIVQIFGLGLIFFLCGIMGAGRLPGKLEVYAVIVALVGLGSMLYSIWMFLVLIYNLVF